MAHPPCCPKLGLLSSASSPRAWDKQPMLPSSQVQVRGVQVDSTSSAKSRSKNECGPNDTPFIPVPTVLSSNKSTPMAKESGVNSQHTFLSNSIVNSQIGMREPWLIWLSCLESRGWSAVTKVMIGWVNQIDMGCIRMSLTPTEVRKPQVQQFDSLTMSVLERFNLELSHLAWRPL